LKATFGDFLTILKSERLMLVPLSKEQHFDATRRMNGDAELMQFIFGRAETEEETSKWLESVADRWQKQGHGWWALMKDDEMIGAATLQRLAGEPNAPLEIGWRLQRSAHKQGYASEAARAIIEYARSIGVTELVAVAHPENRASHAVMERIGMVYVGQQFHYGQSVTTYRLQL
jgi:RimJ/RimL family protein N-acetyltransferase